MNYRRGFFRMWVFFTAVWVIVAGATSFSSWYHDPWRVIHTEPITHAHITANGSDKLMVPDTKLAGHPVPCWDMPENLRPANLPPDECVEPIPGPNADYSPWWDSLRPPIFITFGPPIALLFLGAGAIWTLKGFMS